MIWRFVSSVSGGSASRSASASSRRCSARRGRAARSRPTRHAPTRRRAGGRGSSRPHKVRRGVMSPARRRSMPTWPCTDTTTSDAGDVATGDGAGEQDRLAHRIAEGRHPQVVLELGQRLGKGLGDWSRPVDRSSGSTTELGGDGSRLQEEQAVLVVDRPLDVLGRAEDPLHPPRERREPAQVERIELRAVAGVALEGRADLVDEVARTVDEPAHERLRSTVDHRHDAVVGSAGDGVDAEQHAAELGGDERLHEHRDRIPTARRRGPVSRARSAPRR